MSLSIRNLVAIQKYNNICVATYHNLQHAAAAINSRGQQDEQI